MRSSYSTFSGRSARVVERFVPDHMDSSSIPVEVGIDVQIVGLKGDWATVRTPSGLTGDVPTVCLQTQQAPQPAPVYPTYYSMAKATPHSADTPVPEKLAPYVCELVGTFILVFVVSCCSACGTSQWNATAIGFTLMVLVYATGSVSGGNLNPCVTLMLFFTRKIGALQALLYIVLQMLGGILAGLLGAAIFAQATSVQPVSPFGLSNALIVECIYTFMLCFVVGNVAGSKRNNPKDDNNQFYAIAIGFVIIAGGYAAGEISGACFNPAVAVGLDLAAFANGATLGLSWAYSLAELAGAFGAVFLYLFLRREDYWQSDNLRDFAPSLVMRITAEFIGTFILGLTVGLNVVLEHTMTAWSAAAALLCMIYALGNVSGGHFNPAVTFGVTLSGREKCTGSTCLAYMLTQFAAGIAVSFLVGHLHAAGPTSSKVFGLAPQGVYNWYQTFASEMVFTFLLVFVVLAVATVDLPPATSTKQNFYFALAIGSCVAVGGFAMGAVSGGSLNPAVSLGLALEASGSNSLGTNVTAATAVNATGTAKALTKATVDAAKAAAAIANSTNATKVTNATASLIALFALPNGSVTTAANGTVTTAADTNATAIDAKDSIASAVPTGIHAPRLSNFVSYSLFEFAGAFVAACVFHITHAGEYRKYRHGSLLAQTNKY